MPTSPSAPEPTDPARLVRATAAWYRRHRRDLPWRRTGVTPWGVLVSEVMLQQTPVARVLPVWQTWMRDWPTPSALAAEVPGTAIRAWGRLGYPRRALRLHQTAVVIDERHDGMVPRDGASLRELPGIGEYTAAAVQSFAFGIRVPVLDTNVRRVHARLFDGLAAAGPAVTRREHARADALLPRSGRAAATAGVAFMELGALVCTARSPRCDDCPVKRTCAWRLAGSPANAVRAKPQGYDGTDRQARGVVLAQLREATAPVPAEALARDWPDRAQRDRALAGLMADGLVTAAPNGGYLLPGVTAG